MRHLPLFAARIYYKGFVFVIKLFYVFDKLQALCLLCTIFSNISFALMLLMPTLLYCDLYLNVQY